MWFGELFLVCGNALLPFAEIMAAPSDEMPIKSIGSEPEYGRTMGRLTARQLTLNQLRSAVAGFGAAMRERDDERFANQRSF